MPRKKSKAPKRKAKVPQEKVKALTKSSLKIRRTVYLSPEADAIVRHRVERRGINISMVIEEALFGGPAFTNPVTGESWRMPEAPLSSLFVRRFIDSR